MLVCDICQMFVYVYRRRKTSWIFIDLFFFFFFLVHNEFLCVSRSFHLGANLKEDVISVFELISRARGLVPTGYYRTSEIRSRGVSVHIFLCNSLKVCSLPGKLGYKSLRSRESFFYFTAGGDNPRIMTTVR